MSSSANGVSSAYKSEGLENFHLKAFRSVREGEEVLQIQQRKSSQREKGKNNIMSGKY
jgi:hypothetical protein